MEVVSDVMERKKKKKLMEELRTLLLMMEELRALLLMMMMLLVLFWMTQLMNWTYCCYWIYLRLFHHLAIPVADMQEECPSQRETVLFHYQFSKHFLSSQLCTKKEHPYSSYFHHYHISHHNLFANKQNKTKFHKIK